MNSGLMVKSLREVWLMTLLFGVGHFLFQFLLACILPNMPDDISVLLSSIKFIQHILTAILGVEMTETIGPEILASIAWVHPVVLILLWAHAIVFCTRLPAGEIDRGTADVLLSVPISRTQHYLSETMVWLPCGLAVVLLGLAGNLIGARLMGVIHFGTLGQRLVIMANLYSLYLAVGGVAWLTSSLSDRRGRAVGVVFGIVMASFMLGFFTPFNATIKKFSFLAIMQYHRPVHVIQETGRPVANMAILLSVALITWAAGAIIFARRDIRTV